MRVRWRNFSKGVWASGSREAVPQGYARRLKGFAGSESGDYLRLRRAHGGRILTEISQDVHSIGKLATNYYYGAGRGFGFSPVVFGTPVTGTTLFAHNSNFLSGSRLTFVSGKPVAGKGVHDYIFCAGGNLLFKLRNGFTGFSRWGIPAPTAPITGGEIGLIAGQTFRRPSLLDFDAPAQWTATNSTLTFPVDNLDPGLTGACMQIAVGSDTAGKALGRFNPLANLAEFGTDYPSSDQDWIVIDVKIINVKNFDALTLIFYNDPSGNNQSGFAFTVVADDPLVREATAGATGLGDIGEISDDETGFLENAPSPVSGTSRDILERMAILKHSGIEGAWTRLKIPKSAFVASNPTAVGQANGWSSLSAFEAIVTSNKNGSCSVRLNHGSMFGGAGMQGRYKYCYTLRDPQTGHRSNPSPIFTLDTYFRSGTQLQVPLAPEQDPEVAQRAQLLLSASGSPLVRELWRTFGNGSVFFKHSELVSNGGTAGTTTTRVIDRVADFRGMHNIDMPASVLNSGIYFAFGTLGTEVLTFDNIAPGHYFGDAFGLGDGRMWWCRDTDPAGGAQGRVYYSPPGRIESVEGFIEIAGSASDPTQKGVIWNGKYVFTQKRMFEIVGSTTPYLSREVLGVPGTLWPHTVVPTPYGIIYEAVDGIRVFDGSGSQLLPLPPVEVFFRRDTAGRGDAGLGAYATNINHYACFFQDEYRWTDGTTGLAFNLRTGAWRVMDAPPTAWLADAETGECFAGRNGYIVAWESDSTGNDDTRSSAADISCEFETPGFLVDGRQTFLVQRVYLDVCVPTSDSLTVQLVTDDGVPGSGGDVVAVGTITGSGARELVEFGVPCAYVSVPGVRLSGTFETGVLRIYGVEMDVHIPEEPGAGT